MVKNRNKYHQEEHNNYLKYLISRVQFRPIETRIYEEHKWHHWNPYWSRIFILLTWRERPKMLYWNLTWILTYGIVFIREGIPNNVTNKCFGFSETVLFKMMHFSSLAKWTDKSHFVQHTFTYHLLHFHENVDSWMTMESYSTTFDMRMVKTFWAIIYVYVVFICE